jgi:hypothetical protein
MIDRAADSRRHAVRPAVQSTTATSSSAHTPPAGHRQAWDALREIDVRRSPVPNTADWEERHVREYVEGQLRDAEDGVTLVQRVGQERVIGTTYAMYDVHTIKGRWWVITEPTNLYDQKSFPQLDYTLSFHIGIGMRISERSRVEASADRREYAEGRGGVTRQQSIP